MIDDELDLSDEEEALREGDDLDGFDAEEFEEEDEAGDGGDESIGDWLAAGMPARPPDLGPCCACGAAGARNVALLPRRAPRPGTGWGCIPCGLRSDGAVAVLCDECAESGREPTEVADGYLAGRRRVPVSSLAPGAFDHDPDRHPGEAV
ncbi:MAG: hypothetical protein U0790_00275 [Isosphaeraceae bacterium]